MGNLILTSIDGLRSEHIIPSRPSKDKRESDIKIESEIKRECDTKREPDTKYQSTEDGSGSQFQSLVHRGQDFQVRPETLSGMITCLPLLRTRERRRSSQLTREIKAVQDDANHLGQAAISPSSIWMTTATSSQRDLFLGNVLVQRLSWKTKVVKRAAKGRLSEGVIGLDIGAKRSMRTSCISGNRLAQAKHTY